MGGKNKLKQVFKHNKAHDQGLTLHFEFFFALNCQCIFKIKTTKMTRHQGLDNTRILNKLSIKSLIEHNPHSTCCASNFSLVFCPAKATFNETPLFQTNWEQ
jgi:hypothetical protein